VREIELSVASSMRRDREILVVTDQVEPYEFMLALDDGTYALRGTAIDHAGNESSANHFVTIEDGQAVERIGPRDSVGCRMGAGNRGQPGSTSYALGFLAGAVMMAARRTRPARS
jgi:hypothetical protein